MQLESLTGVLSYTFDDAGLKKAQAELATTARANTELTDSQKAGAEWSEKYSAKLGATAVAAGTMAAAGGVVTAALLDSVGAAKEYEASLAMVATLSPEAAARTGEYKQQILEVSTALGTNAVDSANALYDALSSGVPPENAISFMATASKAAVAGATDTGTAVTGLNAVINAWGLNAAEAGKVGDVFFQGVNLGVMRFEDLAGSIGQVAPLAASLGVSFEQVSAATAKLTKGGLTASQAVTQQRAAMVALITPNEDMVGILDDVAAGNEDVARYAEENGVSTGKAMLATLGFQGSMEALRATADGTGANMEKALGSVEAIGAVFGLTGENAAEARQFLDDMNGSAGATENAFAKMADTTDFKWKQMQAAINNTRIALGDALLPVVGLALDLFNPLADAALAGAQALGQLPTPVLALGAGFVLLATGGAAVVAVLAGMAAAFGPGLIAMTEAAGLTSALGLAWAGASATIVGAAGAAAAAILPLIAPILAVSAVVLALKKGHDDLAASMDKGYTSVQKMGGGFDAYLAATKKAKEETTGLGKVWATLGSNEGLDLQKSTQAWLTYGAGVDEALLKTTEFQKAQHAAGQEWQKTGDVEAYKEAMLAAADAASVAAGQGHLLTEEQKRQADAFSGATAELLARAGPMASALAQDEEFIAKQKELSAAVTDGTKTQGQALVEMNAYIAKRADQAAADQKAAQAAADNATAVQGAAQQYSSALNSMAGGTLTGFAPDREVGEKEAEKRQKENEKLRDERVSHFAEMYNKRQEFQAQEEMLISQGKAAELVTLRESYANELQAQQEHMGQLAVNQMMASLQAGTLAEEQAMLMLGSMQAAFPDADFMAGNLAGMVDFSATLGGALQGNTQDALNMGAALQKLPADIDAGAAAAESLEQNAVASFQATLGAAEEAAAGTVASNVRVSASSAERAALTGESLGGERAEYALTSGASKTESDKTVVALGNIGTAATGAGSQVATGMGTIRSEVASLPGAMSKAAGDTQAQAALIGKAFTVSGEQARAYTREAKGAMDDAASGAADATKETQTYSGTSTTAHQTIASGAKTSTAAVRDHGETAVEQYNAAGQGAKEYSEETKRLNESLKQLPKDIRVQMTLVGAAQFKQVVQEILADLRNIPEVKTVLIRGKYEGTGVMEEGHSLQLQHDLEDIYAVVDDNGPIVLTGLFDSGGGVITEQLPWQKAVEAYYEKLGEADQYVDRFMAIVNEAMGSGGRWETIMAAWSDKATRGWMDVSAAVGGVGSGKDVELPDFRKLTGSPEEAKKEWSRFWEDVERTENERARHADEFLQKQSRRFDAGGNETMSEKIEEERDREKNRHKLVMDNIASEREASERYFERNGDYYAALQQLLKQAQEAIKERQKVEQDAENGAYSQTMERIEDEVRLRKAAHDTILSDIEDRKRIEAEAYAASMKALDEQSRQIKEQADVRARELSHYKEQIEQQKLDLDITGAKDKLDQLKKDASEFSSVMGKLEDTKKVTGDDEKRRKERVKLHTDAQRDMLRKYGGMVAEEDQRTVALMLAGYEVRGSEADRVMEQINARLGEAAKGQEGVISAKEREAKELDGLLRQAEAKAKTEKEADDAKLRAIDEIKRKSQEAHTEYVRQIDLEKRQEDERYKAEQAAIASLKEAEKDRHEAELKRINEQYALELLKLGKTEEEVQAILAQRAEEARRISEEADRRYKEAIAAVEAESARLQGEQKAHEDSVRTRVNAMYQDLIERMRAIAQAIGGEAGKAIDDLLAKLLDQGSGVPAVAEAWAKVEESIVKATKALRLYQTDIGEAASSEDEKERAEKRKGHWETPDAKLNASTKRGAGGFRAGNDWTQWHGKWVPDEIPEEEDPATRGAATPPPTPPGGHKTRPGGPPGATGRDPNEKDQNKTDGTSETNPWRYAETNPWRYGRGDSPTNPMFVAIVEGAASGGTGAPGLPGAPPTESLGDMNAAMQAWLAGSGISLGDVPPAYTAYVGRGGTKIDYHHYGDNVFVGDTAAEDFLTGLHMAP